MALTLPKSEPGSEPPKRDVYVGAAVAATNIGVAAARLALLPARALGRTNVVRRQVDELAATGNEATAHALDRVVAAVDDAFSSAEARNALDRVLDDETLRTRILEQLQRALQSPEGQQLIEQVVASPAVRNALTNETTAAVEDFATRVRAHLATADDDVERRIGRTHDRSQPASVHYGGVVSRAVAFSTDAVLANVLYLIGAGLVALIASLAGGLRPEWLAASIAAVGWIAVSTVYFVGFWTLAGQTPGMLLLQQRVSTQSGEQIGVGRALVRLLVLFLSIVPFFAGAITMLFDSRRRGLWDLAAGTVVTLEGD
jgi:uncharacterized RDD family membrane protein YckC